MNKRQENKERYTEQRSAFEKYYNVTGDGVFRADLDKLLNDQGFLDHVGRIFSKMSLNEKE